tara:strand:- start:135 stop:419 length:285 start_codon:yes stop_codon:yes gene_type:complete
MSQNKDTILKLRKLIELREKTIIANKRQMKDYLVEYKKSLELDKELRKEQNSLKEAINLLQYGSSLSEDDTEEIFKSENIALNRDEYIYTDDEE